MMNKERQIISLKNSQTLYKRFLLLSQNDVPRIQQLIKACIKQGVGMSAIIDKFGNAANGLYKAKQFNQADKDLATLVLRIGGPGLLNSFSKLNKLPSQSYMYKVD